MNSQGILIDRLTDQQNKIQKLLRPGSTKPVRTDSKHPFSPVDFDFGGNKFLIAANKMKYLQQDKLGLSSVTIAQNFSQQLSQTNERFRHMIHLINPNNNDGSFWQEIAKIFPSQRSFTSEPQLKSNELGQGSIIQKFNTFPKPGQSAQSFKEQAESRTFQRTSIAQPEKKKTPAPTDRLFTKVQEISDHVRQIPEPISADPPSNEPPVRSAPTEKIQRQPDVIEPNENTTNTNFTSLEMPPATPARQIASLPQESEPLKLENIAENLQEPDLSNSRSVGIKTTNVERIVPKEKIDIPLNSPPPPMLLARRMKRDDQPFIKSVKPKSAIINKKEGDRPSPKIQGPKTMPPSTPKIAPILDLKETLSPQPKTETPISAMPLLDFSNSPFPETSQYSSEPKEINKNPELTSPLFTLRDKLESRENDLLSKNLIEANRHVDAVIKTSPDKVKKLFQVKNPEMNTRKYDLAFKKSDKTEYSNSPRSQMDRFELVDPRPIIKGINQGNSPSAFSPSLSKPVSTIPSFVKQTPPKLNSSLVVGNENPVSAEIPPSIPASSTASFSNRSSSNNPSAPVNTIQRIWSEHSESHGGQPSQGSDANEQNSGQSDMEGLAHKVFPLVKQLLEIELERTGSRFTR